MMLYYVILLLLYWPCVRSIDHVTDQMAVASQNTYSSISKIVNHESLLLSPTKLNNSTIHYKNSNGFVPILSDSNHRRAIVVQPTNTKTDFSNDFKLVLNISHPDANRRLDSENDPKEFEILKVNEKTPAVANYHEFYENLRKNKENNNDNHNYNYPSGISNNRKLNYYRTKERMKQIENYLNHNKNQHYSAHANVQNTMKKTNSNNEKLQDNYPQYGLTEYDTHAKNNWNNQAAEVKHQHVKPVVVEPIDYKVNLNYEPQPTYKVSSVSPPSLKFGRNLSEDRYDRNEDYSDENSDYYEVTERSRKLHKSRRKPYSESSRKLPKEHRGSDDQEEWKRPSSSRTKSHRPRGKPSHWNDEDHISQEENSAEAPKETQYRDKGSGKNDNQKEKSNSWSQVGPNVEFSPSNAYELSQIDKPDVLVPVNFKLVPVTNFDHNTAIGNSQGVGVSNAGTPNFIPSGSIVSTAAPLVSNGPPIIMQTTPTSYIKNNHVYSTVSDIVVGQNSFQTPVQTLLLPQVNHKYNPNIKTYIQSTASPLYTINPTVQSLTTIQTPATSKSHGIGPQASGPQLFYPSSTMQPVYHAPAATNYNIMVNPYSVHGQNIPTATSTHNHGNSPSSSGDIQTKKNNFPSSHGGHLIASASYSVSHGDQTQNHNANSNGNNNNNNHDNNNSNNNNNNNNVNNNNHNNPNNKYFVPMANVNSHILSSSLANAQLSRPQAIQTNLYPVFKNENLAPKIKTFLPHIVPGFIQATPVPAVNMINYGQAQGQQYNNVGNNILENTWKQLQQLQANDPQRYHTQNIYSSRDHIGSPSNNHENIINVIQTNDKAQLPVVGMQNVEILNPNLTPVSAQVIPQYPTAIVTTPIPIVSTPAGYIASGPLVTPAPAEPTIQSYVDSLTHIGTKPVVQNAIADSALYNPMNFVPNVELIKSQTILNGRIQEPLPPSLNLVPIIPGGKFYKHDHAAQSELISKPKLSSDLEKYAEEMFKESIRTIYNTHKWNTDKRVKNLTFADGVDFGKLKKDLERIRSAMSGSKYGKEILEAHHSETQFHTADPLRSKKPGLSISALEHLFKNDFKPSSDSFSSSRPTDLKINDYLTPPEMNSFIASSPFIEKSKKKKKRTKSRPHSRPSSHNSRPSNLETSASHVTFHRRPHHNRNVYGDYRGKENYLNNYPTFTTSSPDFNVFQHKKNHHASKSDYIDFSLPRTHNFLGWLMKAKQLPPGAAESLAQNNYNNNNYNTNNYNDNNYQYYFDENRRIFERNASLQPVPVPYYGYHH